jgi:hypothetical protein
VESGDATREYSEKIVPPPPSAGGHEVEVSAVAEASASATPQVGGDVVEVLAADVVAAHPQVIIDLDRLDLPGDDTTIFEAVPERLLSKSEESGGRGLRVCCA